MEGNEETVKPIRRTNHCALNPEGDIFSPICFGFRAFQRSGAIHRFLGKAFTEGIEKHIIDGVEIKLYSTEKTLADCFKFRNQLGMDVVLEAMKLYKSKKKVNTNAIVEYSKICRVEKQMRPYIESLI